MLAPNDERMNALRARWQGVQQWLESLVAASSAGARAVDMAAP